MVKEKYETLTQSLRENLEKKDDIQALVFLGSTGSNADQWSDHDFFVITDPGKQEKYRMDLSWIPGEKIFYFQDTPHGLKVFIEPGHLLDFAVFDASEIFLSQVTQYKVIFDKTGVTREFGQIQQMTILRSQTHNAPREIQWGRILFYLYTAYNRYLRGEILSAYQLSHCKAMELVLRIVSPLQQPLTPSGDIMDPFRKFEIMFPAIAGKIHKTLSLDTPGFISAILILLEEILYPALDESQRKWGEWLKQYIQKGSR